MIRVRSGYVLAMALSGLCGSADAIIIDHTVVGMVQAASDADLAPAADHTWYLAHASVGDNITWGVGDLHNASPTRYSLVTMGGGDTPPATVSQSVFYSYYRGNIGWQAKVDSFKTDLANGWGDKADVLINKLCFVDPDADWQYYAVANANGSALAQLETQYPTKKFVYCTIPLVAVDHHPEMIADLVKINQFNDNLRQWARANNKTPLDIADIKSHTPDGTAVTFIDNGKVYQSLYDSYANGDYEHLVPAGYDRVALGMYAVTGSFVPEPVGIALACASAASILARPRLGKPRVNGETRCRRIRHRVATGM